MTESSSIPIVYYEAERIPDDRPGARQVTPALFWKVRETILQICQRHGRTGPEVSGDLDYFVVEDQYNEERYQYLEAGKPSAMTKEWLLALMNGLRTHAYWGVGITGIGEGYILIFADCLMVTGPTFKGCQTIEDVVDRARRMLVLESMINACSDDLDLDNLSRLAGIEAVNLQRLHLSKVTDAGLGHLARFPFLRDLGLSGSRITDQGIPTLKVVAKLEELSLQDTAVGDTGLAYLGEFTGLKELNLSGTRVTNAGLSHLQRLRNLEVLYLSRTRITDEGLAPIGTITSLKRLDLMYCKVGDRGVGHLQLLPRLAQLDLCETQVTDASVTFLQHLRVLERLHLSETQVTTQALLALQRTLPECRIHPDPR